MLNTTTVTSLLYTISPVCACHFTWYSYPLWNVEILFQPLNWPKHILNGPLASMNCIKQWSSVLDFPDQDSLSSNCSDWHRLTNWWLHQLTILLNLLICFYHLFLFLFISECLRYIMTTFITWSRYVNITHHNSFYRLSLHLFHYLFWKVEHQRAYKKHNPE